MRRSVVALALSTLATGACRFDLTEVEVGLARGLRYLKRTLSGELSVPLLEDVVKTLQVPEEAAPYLERMGLQGPEGLEERILRRALVYGLAAEDIV